MAVSTSSISRGKTFSPPMMSISLMRPVMKRWPSASTRPMSPVRKKLSSSITAAVSSGSLK
jgi:hypothetical protein